MINGSSSSEATVTTVTAEKLQKKNNKLHSNKKLPGNPLWPILSGFLLLEQKENETETIASPFLLPVPKKNQESKNELISKPAVPLYNSC